MNLLPEQERRLFARLSVFRGGWTLEAAQQVCPEGAVIDLLDTLVESSLTYTERRSDQSVRFQVLETMREYAEEQLMPEELPALEARHAAYYTDFIEKAANYFRGAEQVLWLDRAEQEQANLHAVMQRATGENLESGLRTAWAMWSFWFIRGSRPEGIR